MMYRKDYVYYDGERIKLPKNRLTKKEQLWLLENHPRFTGRCRECGYEFPERPHNWNCPECGWCYD